MSFEIDTETPYPKNTWGRASKYDELFENLQPGQSLKTDNEATAKRLANAMVNYIKRNKLDGVRPSIRMNMDDGYHRVFLIKKPVKMADLPSRKIVNMGMK